MKHAGKLFVSELLSRKQSRAEQMRCELQWFPGGTNPSKSVLKPAVGIYNIKAFDLILVLLRIFTSSLAQRELLMQSPKMRFDSM